MEPRHGALYIWGEKMKKYFIHAITNYVSIYNVAAIIKAVGAYPIMADDYNESASITKNADALYINLGMLNENKKNRDEKFDSGGE